MWLTSGRAVQGSCGRVSVRQTQRPGVVARAGLDDFKDAVRDFYEKTKFEAWAPKSSRAWRLRQYPSEVQSKRDAEEEENFAKSLEDRMRRLSNDAQDTTAAGVSQLGSRPPQAEEPQDALSSFSDSDDASISSAFAARAALLTDATPAQGSLDANGVLMPTAEMTAPLTAQELMDLVEQKYGNKYDMTIARRSALGRSFVSLNIMWVHVEQRSFPMSLEDYLDKLDGICIMVNAWNRQALVRGFLQEKARGKNGMPPRPIVGCAVAVQLDLPEAVVSEWLGDRMG